MNAPVTVAQAFLYSAERYGGDIALITLEGERTTYRELHDRVREAVRVLQRLGCGKGDRVAILLPNSPGWAVFEYACALLGCIIVPVNLRYRANEVAYVLRQGRAKVLLVQRKFLTNDLIGRILEIGNGRLGEGDRAAIPELPPLERIVLVDEGDPLPGAMAYADLVAAGGTGPDLARLAAERTPDDPLWVFWTSGTTSRPKGAIIDQSGIGNVWNWTSMVGYRPTDRVMANFPLFYIAGNFWCLLGAMLHGAALVLAQVFSSSELAMLSRREGVTILSGVPMMLKQIADDPTVDRADFATVRVGFFGGSTMTAEEITRVRERVGYETLVQVYGMTELQGFATSTHPDDPPEVVARSCGYPLPGFEFRLAKPGTSEPVAEGEAGELLVKGRRLLDYEGITDEQRAAFFDTEGWFHTGDLLRRDRDGRYAFAGRSKDLIKVGGENVSAAEIESVILDHPDVGAAVVIPRPDERRGEVPIALVSAKPGMSVDAEALRVWCREKMAPFKVPAAIRIVDPDRWPRTASGKIAKWQLDDLLADPT